MLKRGILIEDLMTIDEILSNEERQIFNRKSVMIEPKALAISVVGFANKRICAVQGAPCGKE